MSKKNDKKSKKVAAREAAVKAQKVEDFGEELGLRDGGDQTWEWPPTAGPFGSGVGDSSRVSRRQSRRSSRQNHGVLTINDFEQLTYSCGVFKIQKGYQVMVKEAHANGRSIENEMKAQGFKDYNAFARSCERFNLSCSPSELAELGSGFTLYFDLLALMASLLVVVALLQVPAMNYNKSFDSLDQWWWHDWQGAWSSSGSSHIVQKPPEGAEGLYISSYWLTPGNLGPDEGDDSFIIFVAAILSPILHILFARTRSHQLATEDRVDSDTTSPHDFAVMVKGLPSNATDEKLIEDFFRQHAVRGKTDTEIVKVVIGWDAQDFRDKMKEIQTLRARLESIPYRDSEQARAIQGRIKQISDEIAMQAGSDSSALKSAGVAVVVLRNQHDARACLQRWTTAWARHFYADADDVDWLPPQNGLKRGPPLPRFRMHDGVEWPESLRVERAPNPGDINWMRLGVGKWERRQKLAITTLMMVVIVAVSFLITWGLNELQKNVQESSAKHEQSSDSLRYQQYGFRFLSILIGTGVSMINMMIRVFARYFGEEEFHDTHTDKEFSQALKMSVGMIINTSGIIFWLNPLPKSWYEKGGLVEDVFYVLIMDAIVAQFWMFLDVVYIGNYFERQKITPEKLTDWNTSIAGHYPPRSDEDKEALQAVRVEILKFKQVFEPAECDNPHRYASALNTFVCCIFYTPVCPLLPFVGLLGMLCQYWVDKFLLLRWQKRPRPQNGNMARWSLKFLKTIAPFVIPSSVFTFVTPSWKDKASCWYMFTMTMATAFVMNFIPLSLWRVCFCRKLHHNSLEIQEDDFEDYYHAQYMWPKEMKYHKDQFLYKALPDEKNPEMLELGQDRTLKVDEMQGKFATAVQNVAALTAYGNRWQAPMKGASAAGYGDRCWGGAWFHETPATHGPGMHNGYGPGGIVATPPSWSPAFAAPAVADPAAYPGYSPCQPAAARYGVPAAPRPCAPPSFGSPATYNSWGTPTAPVSGSPGQLTAPSWGAQAPGNPGQSGAPAPSWATSQPGSPRHFSAPAPSWDTHAPGNPGQFGAPSPSWGTPQPGGNWQAGATAPGWGTGAVRPPALGGVWGTGAQTQATPYEWPARSRF